VWDYHTEQTAETEAAVGHVLPLLAVWGRGDEIFGPAGAEAFAEDLPDAEIHLLNGGQFLLELALDEVTELIRALP
jgi:pimeloyl-ACP methyl ester carboxylesterase